MSHCSVRFALPAVILVLAVVTPLSAQSSCVDPCLRFYSDTEVAGPFDLFHIEAAIEAPSVRGWSFGICHDPLRVRPVAAVPGPAIANLDAMGFLDFVDMDLSLAGVAMTGALCAAPCAPPLDSIASDLLLITYEPLAGGVAAFVMCSTLQFPPAPPVTNVLITDSGTVPLNSWPLHQGMIGVAPNANPHPDYVLGFEPISDGAPGSVRTATSFIDNELWTLPLAGWSFGICHDSQHLEPIGAGPGADLATMYSGQPVEFFQTAWDVDEGVMSGVVICTAQNCPLVPSGAEVQVLDSYYQVVGVPGEVALLRYCDSVAISPAPTPTILVAEGGASVPPTRGTATIGIAGSGFPLLEPGFLRGDANGSGDVNIADVIAIAMHLFQGSAAPSCSDGADADDNGLLDLADVITLAYALFAVGEPLGPPYPECGADRTSDTLPCASLCP